MRRNRNRNKGITLLEHLIVIVVIGTLLAIFIRLLSSPSILETRCKERYGPKSILGEFDGDYVCIDRSGNMKAIPVNK